MAIDWLFVGLFIGAFGSFGIMLTWLIFDKFWDDSEDYDDE